MEKQLARISKDITALWPGAKISVIKGDRDKVGPLLSVRNQNAEGLENLSRSPDHVVVEIDREDENHVLVIPISQTVEQPFMGH